MTFLATPLTDDRSGEIAPAGAGAVPAHRGTLWEQGLVTLWFLAVFANWPGNALILYPMALFFSSAFLIRRNELLPMVIMGWILFLVPVLAALSWGWSPVPRGALRFGLLMIMGVLAAIYIGTRLNLAQTLRCLFFAGLILMAYTIATGAFPFSIIWPQKNFFADRVLFLLVTAMGIAYNREEPAPLRALAFLVIPVAAYLILRAESVTALVLGLGAVVIMTGIWLFWTGLARIAHLRSLLMLSLAGVACVGGIYLANTQTDYFGMFLDNVGKDRSLTGRTMLWEAAERITQQRPLLGLGAEGFWQWNVGEAQTINELSHKAAGTRFSFHSSYLEVQVHLGLVGLAFLILTVGWTTLRIARHWFATQSVTASTYMVITGMTLTSSFTESRLFQTFDLGMMMLMIAAIATLRPKLDQVLAQPAALFDPGVGPDDSHEGALGPAQPRPAE